MARGCPGPVCEDEPGTLATALHARVDEELSASPWPARGCPAAGVMPAISDAQLVTRRWCHRCSALPPSGGGFAAQAGTSAGRVWVDGPVLRTVQVDPAAQGCRDVRIHPVERRRHGVPVRVEQAERHLLGEYPAQGAIDQRRRQTAVGDGLGQGGSVCLDVGQFDIDARPQRRAGCSGPVRRDAVQGLEEGDGEVVGDDGAAEAPCGAQRAGEQLLVGRGRYAVRVGVGVHHRPGTPLTDRRLEGRKQNVGPLPRPRGGGCEVTAGTGGRVAGEVLEGGDDPADSRPCT